MMAALLARPHDVIAEFARPDTHHQQRRQPISKMRSRLQNHWVNGQLALYLGARNASRKRNRNCSSLIRFTHSRSANSSYILPLRMQTSEHAIAAIVSGVAARLLRLNFAVTA
jgi:hypothetical protein